MIRINFLSLFLKKVRIIGARVCVCVCVCVCVYMCVVQKVSQDSEIRNVLNYAYKYKW